MSDIVPVPQLPAAWRGEADRLERFAPAAAVAFRDAAQQLEESQRAAASDVLTLEEAALASGFSKDHLRHQIATGMIANVGKKGRPRVRAGDLPKKAPRKPSPYDPSADAVQLVRNAGTRRS